MKLEFIKTKSQQMKPAKYIKKSVDTWYASRSSKICREKNTGTDYKVQCRICCQSLQNVGPGKHYRLFVFDLNWIPCQIRSQVSGDSKIKRITSNNKTGSSIKSLTHISFWRLVIFASLNCKDVFDGAVLPTQNFGLLVQKKGWREQRTWLKNNTPLLNTLPPSLS
jgi:hypothetical protein